MTKEQEQLSINARAIFRFCKQNVGKASFKHWDDAVLYQYLVSCLLTGRMAVKYANNEIKCVMFYWSDFREHIEHKYHEGQPQFTWQPNKSGDSIFIADVIGKREYVREIYNEFLKNHPGLKVTPMFTYRHGRLYALYGVAIERFLKGHE